jgi:DNA-damage-inducible protein D
MSILLAPEYKTFEEIKRISDDGNEFWYAREFSETLEYVQWRNFVKVLERAMLACTNSGYAVLDHFAEVSKTIEMPKSASKKVKDYKLSRYACYLIVQNGDPRKEVIALGQTYFAIQTRRQEVRGTIERVGGTMPENLPLPSKSISAVEKEQLKKLTKSPKKLMLDE